MDKFILNTIKITSPIVYLSMSLQVILMLQSIILIAKF